MNRARQRRTLPALAACCLVLGAPAARALTLGEGLATVARSGRDVQVAAAAVAVAESGPRLAAAARRPSVNLFARESLLAYKPESDVGPGRPIPLADRDSFSFGLRVRQLLADFGRTEAALSAAGHEEEAALGARGLPELAADGNIYRELVRQARSLAFNDTFLVTAALLLSVLLLVAAMRRTAAPPRPDQGY